MTKASARRERAAGEAWQAMSDLTGLFDLPADELELLVQILSRVRAHRGAATDAP